MSATNPPIANQTQLHLLFPGAPKGVLLALQPISFYTSTNIIVFTSVLSIIWGLCQIFFIWRVKMEPTFLKAAFKEEEDKDQEQKDKEAKKEKKEGQKATERDEEKERQIAMYRKFQAEQNKDKEEEFKKRDEDWEAKREDLVKERDEKRQADDEAESLWSEPKTPEECLARLMEMNQIVTEGAKTFLFKEYMFLGIFLVLFAIVIYFLAEPVQWYPYTTIAFIIGAITSIACGYIGMMVAVYTNARVTVSSAEDIGKGFSVAYRGGEVLGFVLVGLALLVLILLIVVYKAIFFQEGAAFNYPGFHTLFVMIAGYGLGGSTVALFGRVGGGIYTKAADVGSDLVGKVVAGLDEDSPRNPGVIADNVGDNVGDIAGMGADLFGSLAESTCAALVVSSTAYNLVNVYEGGSIYFPLLVTCSGIPISIITSLFATTFVTVTAKTVQATLKWQLVISTVLETGLVVPVCLYSLPNQFELGSLFGPAPAGTIPGIITPLDTFWCVFAGLWSGLIIGFFTEVMTSNEYGPVQEIAEASRSGEAPNIIYGLALGYLSTIVPLICLAITIFVSFFFAGMYGVALAALGMLSTLPIALSIDGYGPISDNAGGMAELSGLDKEVRARTDKLDAAGNTTAAVGKGFAIGSACLVALALFGGFVTRTGYHSVNILRPLEFAGLILGAMLPYAFSALTMKAVGVAAKDMIIEIKRQMENPRILAGTEKPDFTACINIATQASLLRMIAPGLLVLVTPIIGGLLFGAGAVAGLLAGNIVSGVQVAISFSNTGGAWDNAKKYVEEGIHQSKVPDYIDEIDQEHCKEHNREYFVTFEKGSDVHKACVIGDTVGDPLKDTSGPSINILIKLSAITSLVFGGFFVNTHYLVTAGL